MSEKHNNIVPTPNPGNAYRIMVCEPAGTPVPGVRIQFCSQLSCQMNVTDETGTAVFDSPEGIYTAHVFSVPDGYLEDAAEYPVPVQYGDLVITLHKA